MVIHCQRLIAEEAITSQQTVSTAGIGLLDYYSGAYSMGAVSPAFFSTAYRICFGGGLVNAWADDDGSRKPTTE